MMTFEAIYQQGKRDWIRAMRPISPVMADYVEQGRMPLSAALHMLGIKTGAFATLYKHVSPLTGEQYDIFTLWARPDQKP